jgi:hypothetical protein
MDEVKFETEFLNDYFRKILGKEKFTMADLKGLKDIVIKANKEKITQYDFDILQELEDGIQLEGLDLLDRTIYYATIQIDDSIEMTDIEKINNCPVNRLYFPSLRGLTLEVLNQFSERFKYFIAGDALAYKKHFYTYYTKNEMKIILSKLEEIKNLIPQNANDITKFMSVYKWIGLHASYSFRARGKYITNEFSFEKERKKIERITRSLLGVLIEGEALCEGYAWALVTCLNYIGLPARVVAGELEGGGHSWIQVKIDGIWYNACLANDYKDIQLQNPLNFCLRSDEYFKANEFKFKQYNTDIDEKNEQLPLENCISDYPRDNKGNLLNDNSSFIDEHYKSLLVLYQYFYQKQGVRDKGEIEEEDKKGKTK